MRSLGIATTLVCAALITAAPPAGAGDAGYLLHQADLEVARLTGSMPAGEDAWASNDDFAGTGRRGSDGPSVLVPMAMSLVLPGAGELYLGHQRGYLQIVLDAAAWYGAIHHDGKGEDKRDEYYAYADQHWALEKLDAAYDTAYLDRPDADFDYQDVVGVGRDYFSNADDPITHYTDLPLWVSAEADRREYYENLGKWDQFVFGWDDFNDPRDFLDLDPEDTDITDLRDPRTSAHREAYRKLRRESNDHFSDRDRFIYLSIAFRMFSVLQVAYLEGLLFGERDTGEPRLLEVRGHRIDFFAEPVGVARGVVGATVSF